MAPKSPQQQRSACRQSMHQRAGLSFPVRAIKRRMPYPRCGVEGSICTGAILENLAAMVAGAAASHSKVLFNPARRGKVSSESIDGLVRNDATFTFASLLRASVPFNYHTVCVNDADNTIKHAAKDFSSSSSSSKANAADESKEE